VGQNAVAPIQLCGERERQKTDNEPAHEPLRAHQS
jgi:hypothetical protein